MLAADGLCDGLIESHARILEIPLTEAIPTDGIAPNRHQF